MGHREPETGELRYHYPDPLMCVSSYAGNMQDATPETRFLVPCPGMGIVS